ncbi:CPBP family intramembrane glutamic endopeptidase [Roseivirga sp.]|uniref:CPBP family intramembrane glutamic endopeptidase n=1 Tax=Roseivirga sp. TaxID=1964215 RepID=UPI003B8B67F5
MERNRNLYWIVIISVGFAALLAFAVPFRLALGQYLENEKEVKLIAGIGTRLIILVASIILVRKFKFQRYLGLGWKFDRQYLLPIIIPMLIVSMAIFGDLETYKKAGLSLLTLFLFNNILVALIEEFAFRGLVLPLILKIRSEKKRLMLTSVSLTALIFGVLHYLNLFREPDNFSGITSQVIFAIAIGIFLGGLMLRTKNILFPVLIHFLINVGFGKDILRPETEEIVTQVASTGTDWIGTLLTLGLFGFIALGGVYMVRLVSRDEILQLINTDN